MPETLENRLDSNVQRASSSRGRFAHHLAVSLDRYYGSVSDLATALATTRDTVRAWLKEPPARVRTDLVARARRLWQLCRAADRYFANRSDVGRWTLAPHMALGGTNPAQALIEQQDAGLERLLDDMVLYAPARPDLPLDARDDEIQEMIATGLGPEAMARIEQITDIPELEVTDDDLAELSAFESAGKTKLKGAGERRRTMPRSNDSDRYVQPNKDRGGWDIVKEGHARASAHTRTKTEAINRARQIVRNQGGGEIRIKNEKGRLIDSDTIKGSRHKESRARDRK